MFGKIWGRIRENHFAMMAICCLLPIIFIVAMKMLGIDAWWVYIAAIGVCIGSHLLMAYLGSKGEKTCH